MIKITPISVINVNGDYNIYLNEVSYLYKFMNTDNLIQKIICSFHDYDHLYFVSKFYEGFINNHLSYNWSEKQIQFYSACLINSFINLRNEKLIHRDIHFGNLVLDEKQYVNLIDFHVVMNYSLKNNPKFDVIGSPELCAPEMVNRLEYDYNSDYYRLGSMLYYLIFRKYPNYIMKEKNITQIKINIQETKNYSSSCIDFINKLIIVNKTNRIGFDNVYELMNHSFFIDFDWKNFLNKSMISPFHKIARTSLNLCNKNISFTKEIYMNDNLTKNIKFLTKLFSYDNINKVIVDKIINDII